MPFFLAIPAFILGAFALYVVFALFADIGPWRRLLKASLKTIAFLLVIGVLYFIGDSIIGQLSWGWKALYAMFLLGIVGVWISIRRRMHR